MHVAAADFVILNVTGIPLLPPPPPPSPHSLPQWSKRLIEYIDKILFAAQFYQRNQEIEN